MGHNHRIDLLIRHRRLILTGIEPLGIDFPGNLLNLHPIARTGQEIDYGFFEFHQVDGYRIQITPAISAAGMARTMPIKPPLIWNQ